MTNREMWQLLFDLRADASRGPADIGIENPEKDPIEQYRERVQRSGGENVWLVWLPEHPETKLGDKGRDAPEHAIIIANTGNGPTSEANARFIAAIFHYQRDLLDLAYEGLVALEAKEADRQAGGGGDRG